MIFDFSLWFMRLGIQDAKREKDSSARGGYSARVGLIPVSGEHNHIQRHVGVLYLYVKVISTREKCRGFILFSMKIIAQSMRF